MSLLSNKVAIITGASSGIGRASAILFAREGASVVLAPRGVCNFAASLSWICWWRRSGNSGARR